MCSSDLIDERDVRRLQELGDLIRNEFRNALECTVHKQIISPTQSNFEIHLNEATNELKYIVLQEDLTKGQRVESFSIIGEFVDGAQYPMYQGTTIGNKRICKLHDPFEGQNPLIGDGTQKLNKITVRIKAARAEVFLKEVKIYS